MILFIQCVILCILFTLAILPPLFKDPVSMIMSYPPNIIKRVEQLPQYQGTIKKTEKAHIAKKIFACILFVVILAVIAYFSGCKDFSSTFIHVFVLFFVVNVYDMVVLDWILFCNNKKVRIPGTEDMELDYKDYLFHAKGAVKGILLGVIVSLLSACLVWAVSVL